MSTAASTIRHALGAGLEAIILLAIVAALAFGVALASGHPAGAGSVFAAKGGHAAVQTQPWMAATPQAVGAGQSFNVSAGGLDPTESTWLLIETSTARSWVSGGVDASGGISLDVTVWQVGRATLSTYQVNSAGKFIAVASCWVDVS